MSQVEQGGESARLRRSDRDAWDSLYTRLFPNMLTYARRRLGDRELAKDAVAETFSRAVATRERFPLEQSPDAWCFGILRHVVLDLQRRRYRERDRVPGDTTVASPEVGERLGLADDYDELRSAFERLGDDERELLELRVIAGLSSDNVARTLDMSPGAVRMAQSRALSKLRSILEEVSR